MTPPDAIVLSLLDAAFGIFLVYTIGCLLLCVIADLRGWSSGYRKWWT